MANATVLVVGATTGTVSSHSNESGHFVVESLASGQYDFTASAPGLLGEARGVAISDKPATVDITMRVSAISETLVVSATQIDQPLSRTADSVTVISGQELESRQITSLGEALSTVPGFTVARSGGPGTLTSLFPEEESRTSRWSSSTGSAPTRLAAASTCRRSRSRTSIASRSCAGRKVRFMAPMPSAESCK